MGPILLRGPLSGTEPSQPTGGAVVCVCGDPDPNTGETVSVPWLHTVA